MYSENIGLAMALILPQIACKLNIFYIHVDPQKKREVQKVMLPYQGKATWPVKIYLTNPPETKFCNIDR